MAYYVAIVMSKKDVDAFLRKRDRTVFYFFWDEVGDCLDYLFQSHPLLKRQTW